MHLLAGHRRLPPIALIREAVGKLTVILLDLGFLDGDAGYRFMLALRVRQQSGTGAVLHADEGFSALPEFRIAPFRASVFLPEMIGTLPDAFLAFGRVDQGILRHGRSVSAAFLRSCRAAGGIAATGADAAQACARLTAGPCAARLEW